MPMARPERKRPRRAISASPPVRATWWCRNTGRVSSQRPVPAALCIRWGCSRTRRRWGSGRIWRAKVSNSDGGWKFIGLGHEDRLVGLFQSRAGPRGGLGPATNRTICASRSRALSQAIASGLVGSARSPKASRKLASDTTATVWCGAMAAARSGTKRSGRGAPAAGQDAKGARGRAARRMGHAGGGFGQTVGQLRRDGLRQSVDLGTKHIIGRAVDTVDDAIACRDDIRRAGGPDQKRNLAHHRACADLRQIRPHRVPRGTGRLRRDTSPRPRCRRRSGSRRAPPGFDPDAPAPGLQVDANKPSGAKSLVIRVFLQFGQFGHTPDRAYGLGGP